MSHRFMYQNRLSSSAVITPLSMAQGVVGGAVPRVANGSGGVIFTGPYTGDGQRIYTVEIGLAGDVGTATFKWRTTDTAPGSWEASGVLTALTDISLSDGVKARFTAGAGTDFSLGDRWETTASNRFGKRFLYDLDPNQRFRTGAPSDPEFIAFDLLTAQEVKALIAHLHNVSSVATIKIQGGPVPQIRAAQTDGAAGAFVTFAGMTNLRSLVGTASFSIGFTLTAGADVSSAQYYLGDGTAAGGIGGVEFGVDLGRGGAGKLTCVMRTSAGNNYPVAPVIAANTSYRFLFVHDSVAQTIEMFKDGVSTGAAVSLAGTINNPASNLNLFRYGDFDASLRATAGTRIDELAVYGEALNASQAVQEAAGAYAAGSTLLRVGFDEASGGAADSSGNGHAGTLSGGASRTTSVHSPLDETVAWRAGTMFRYLTTALKTYRYWRLRIGGDSANPDGRIEIGELYLGDYFEPSEDFSWNSVPAGEQAVERRQETESGTPQDVLLNRLRSARLGYGHLADAQVASFRAMFQAVKDAANGRNLPLFAHLDVDDGGESLKLYRLGASFAPIVEGPDDNALEIELLERGT